MPRTLNRRCFMGVLKGCKFLLAHQLLFSRNWRLAKSTLSGDTVHNFYKNGEKVLVLFINTRNLTIEDAMEA